MQEEYGDDIQVVFVEAQGTSVPDTHRFILNQKWMSSDAMWTNERPMDSGVRGLPSYVLLGANGEVLEKGNHMGSSTEELIEAEIDKAKKGPEDASKDIQKAWKEFGKGKVAKAFDQLDKAAEDAELAEEAQATRAEFDRRVNARVAAAKWRIDNGFFAAAEDLLDDLDGELKGTEYEAEVAAQAARLDDAALKDEIDAEKSLMRITDKLFEEGFDKKGKHLRALEKFVEKHEGTQAAVRARALLDMAPSGH